MAVVLYVADLTFEIGHWTFLKAFFDTIQYHLVKGENKYPKLFTDLYQGRLHNTHANEVISNLEHIRHELKKYPPHLVIWDINDLSKQPPWGNNVSPSITNLSNYFITSDGKDLFDVLIGALNVSADLKVDISIL